MTGLDVTTEPDVDLSLTADDSENCYVCTHASLNREAVGYVRYSPPVCDCYPNPAPLCLPHYQVVKKYLVKYGPEDWVCPLCNQASDVDSLYLK